MEGTGHVGWGDGNDEGAFGLNLAIGTPFRLEEITLFPPVETSFLNSLRVICIGGFLLFNLGFLVGLRSSRLRTSSLGLLLSKLLGLFSLLALTLD